MIWTCNLQVGVDTIHPATSILDLGVLLDPELTMPNHVSKVASICFSTSASMAGQISSRSWSHSSAGLDCCNFVLVGLPRSNTEPLPRVLNAAARLVVGLGLFEYVSPALKQLHWLPIEHRIRYKLCLLMHLVHIRKAPQCLTDSVVTVAQSIQGVISDPRVTAAYVKPRTRTSKSFVSPVLPPGTVYHCIFTQ